MMDEMSGSEGTASVSPVPSVSSVSPVMAPPPVGAEANTPPRPPVTAPVNSKPVSMLKSAPVGTLMVNAANSAPTTGSATTVKRSIGHTGVKRATLGAKKIGIAKPKTVSAPLVATTDASPSPSSATPSNLGSGELTIENAFDSIKIKASPNGSPSKTPTNPNDDDGIASFEEMDRQREEEERRRQQQLLLEQKKKEKKSPNPKLNQSNTSNNANTGLSGIHAAYADSFDNEPNVKKTAKSTSNQNSDYKSAIPSYNTHVKVPADMAIKAGASIGKATNAGDKMANNPTDQTKEQLLKFKNAKSLSSDMF